MGFWDYASAFGTNVGAFGRGGVYGATFGTGATLDQADMYNVDLSNQWSKAGFETGAMFNMAVGGQGLGKFISGFGWADKAIRSGVESWSDPPMRDIGGGDAFNDPMQQASGGFYDPSYSYNPSGQYGQFGLDGAESSTSGTNYGGYSGLGSFATNDSGYQAGLTGTNYQMPSTGASPYGNLDGAYNAFGGGASTSSDTGAASYGSFATNDSGFDTGSSGTNYSWGDSGSNGSFSDFGSMDFGSGGDW